MITLTAASPVYKGYCVSLSLTTPNRVELTDWNNYQSVAATVGIALADATEGVEVNIQNDGIYEQAGLNLTYLKPVYVFASGTLTQDLPPKNVMKIGMAVSSTKILLRISEFVMVTV